MGSNERKRSVSGPAETPSKKKRFLCKFNPEWAAEAAWLLPSIIDKEHARQKKPLCSIICSIKLKLMIRNYNTTNSNSKHH